MSQYFEAKDVNEKVVLTFDFSSELASGETLTGSITREISVVLGTDGSPSSVWNGSAQFDTGSEAILQGVTGGVAGAHYKIKMTAETTNASKKLSRVGILPVVAS